MATKQKSARFYFTNLQVLTMFTYIYNRLSNK